VAPLKHHIGIVSRAIVLDYVFLETNHSQRHVNVINVDWRDVVPECLAVTSSTRTQQFHINNFHYIVIASHRQLLPLTSETVARFCIIVHSFIRLSRALQGSEIYGKHARLSPNRHQGIRRATPHTQVNDKSSVTSDGSEQDAHNHNYGLLSTSVRHIAFIHRQTPAASAST